MICRVVRVTALLFTLVLSSQVSTHIYGEEEYETDSDPDIYLNDDELIRQMHSMINAYREKSTNGGQFHTETNALVNSKFRTWKRNADLINALLALPKGMTDAGR